MVRYRSGSRSYSPRRSRTPPRRRRLDDRSRPSRSSYRDRRSPAPSGLLVRNIALDARPEDLRVPFERFGPVKDVYLPKNYYTGEPRGFGFVKFRNPEDAAEAKHHLNHTVIGGREIAIVFAEENRKTPQEMRVNSRVSGRYGGSYRRRTPPRSPRRRYRSYSRSPSPVRHDSREKDRGRRDYYSPSHSQSVSRSVSPRDDKHYRANLNPESPRQNDRSLRRKRERGSDKRSSSPMKNGHSPRSPSPRENDRGVRSKKSQVSDPRSPSPRKYDQSLSRSRSPSRSRSYSPR